MSQLTIIINYQKLLIKYVFSFIYILALFSEIFMSERFTIVVLFACYFLTKIQLILFKKNAILNEVEESKVISTEK